jgi:hypothetical protein
LAGEETEHLPQGNDACVDLLARNVEVKPEGARDELEHNEAADSKRHKARGY